MLIIKKNNSTRTMSQAERDKYILQAKPRTTNPISIQDFIKPSLKDIVLDIGTGAGYTAIALAPFVKKVIAVDVDSKILASCNENVKRSKHKNITIEKADAHKLHFQNKSFDLVTSRFLLRHVTDPFSSLKEIQRVLKDKGKVYIVDIFCPQDAMKPWTIISSLRAANKKKYWTYNQFMQMLRDCRFHPILIKPFEFKSYLKEWTERAGEKKPEVVRNLDKVSRDVKQQMRFGRDEDGRYFYYDAFEMLVEKF